MSLQITLLTVTLLWSNIQAFKILVLFPTASYSHQRPMIALTEELVQKGHELFVVSPNAVPGLKSVNYTYVNVSLAYETIPKKKENDAGIAFQQQISKWDVLHVPLLISMIGIQYRSESFLQFQKWVEAEKIKFDVVVTEAYSSFFTCGIARSLAGNAPIITLSTFSADVYGEEENLGSIQHASFVPFIFDKHTGRMNIWQKIDNWFSNKYLVHRFKVDFEESIRNFFREAYGNDKLLDGCSRNSSLMLIASNFLYYYPRLLGPNIVELGPMHIKPTEKLPTNLQAWLDGAEKGVIYFNLGSNMKSTSLPKDARSNFLKYFRELPPGYSVLWKWEGGKIPEQSDNILSQEWIPQQSVLAHPKVKVFITQGGLQSVQETVHYGVPTVGIPWFGDQECNVAKMEDAKVGVRLQPQDLQSYQKVKSALDAVLYDDRYSRNMKKLSAISHDFTSHALEKATFWVEHVARHGGASHLRPATADTTYFQYFCLDIVSVILVSSALGLYVVVSLFTLFIKKICLSSNNKMKQT